MSHCNGSQQKTAHKLHIGKITCTCLSHVYLYHSRYQVNTILMVDQCWSSVVDGRPALRRNWLDARYFLNKVPAVIVSVCEVSMS